MANETGATAILGTDNRSSGFHGLVHRETRRSPSLHSEAGSRTATADLAPNNPHLNGQKSYQDVFIRFESPVLSAV